MIIVSIFFVLIMKQLHPVQLSILTKLLFAPQLSYSDLKVDETMWGNQFSFHLHQLESFGYIEKSRDMRQLTPTGKEYANRISDESQQIEQTPKVSVLIWCTRDSVDGIEYLIYTRLKHPFYGKQWLFGWKIKYGETVQEAAQRELLEETWYRGVAKLIGVKHYLVYSPDWWTLLEDKYMRLCAIHNPQWEFISCDEGDYQWVSVSQLNKVVTNHFNRDDFDQLIDWIDRSQESLYFSEVKECTSDF